MDLRYLRLLYFRRVSRKTKRGLGYYEAWHKHGSFTQPRENRYKNKDRATIRKPVRIDAGTSGRRSNRRS